ncbi:hypothetical protein QWY84_06605 [Aquisalimonas lutea]|uniref:hypothetical protein n=1 Tax=Aquisalimonas lutea TaxID=1327750 RepID=UPI0025B5A998|nr:hypothetical protein [Aquisalimonas lutea]MDN3517270.1 hypothetical protein [Aquisalimonas lutea]
MQASPVLAIRADNRGQQHVCTMDCIGFPRTKAGRSKRVQGLQTGDLVRPDQKRGKYRGIHVGPLAGVRADGRVDVKTLLGKITTTARMLKCRVSTNPKRKDGASFLLEFGYGL